MAKKSPITWLVVAAVAFFLGGVGAGGLQYLRRSPEVELHLAGTAAWPLHAVVTLVAVALGLRLRQQLLRPRRWAPNVPRSVLAGPLLLLLLYAAYRAGVQVLAGLNRNFTVNAWGGPTYLGAMLCHYLDLAVMSGFVVLGLRLLLTSAASARPAPPRTALA